MTTPYDHPEYFRHIDAIRQAPDDDLPRMIVADWLEEHGEADRAEFIRVQCEKANLERESGGKLPVNAYSIPHPEAGDEGAGLLPWQTPKGTNIGSVVELFQKTNGKLFSHDYDVVSCHAWDDNSTQKVFHLVQSQPCPLRDRWRELKAEEDQLVEHHQIHWDRVPLACYTTDVHLPYTRGFLEQIRIRGADWIQHADEIVKRNPVRKVTVTGWEEGYWQSILARTWPGIEFEFEREPVRGYVADAERWSMYQGLATDQPDARRHPVRGLRYYVYGGSRDGQTMEYAGSDRVIVAVPVDVYTWEERRSPPSPLEQGPYRQEEYRVERVSHIHATPDGMGRREDRYYWHHQAAPHPIPPEDMRLVWDYSGHATAYA